MHYCDVFVFSVRVIWWESQVGIDSGSDAFKTLLSIYLSIYLSQSVTHLSITMLYLIFSIRVTGGMGQLSSRSFDVCLFVYSFVFSGSLTFRNLSIYLSSYSSTMLMYE